MSYWQSSLYAIHLVRVINRLLSLQRSPYVVHLGVLPSHLLCDGQSVDIRNRNRMESTFLLRQPAQVDFRCLGLGLGLGLLSASGGITKVIEERLLGMP